MAVICVCGDPHYQPRWRSLPKSFTTRFDTNYGDGHYLLSPSLHACCDNNHKVNSWCACQEMFFLYVLWHIFDCQTAGSGGTSPCCIDNGLSDSERPSLWHPPLKTKSEEQWRINYKCIYSAACVCLSSVIVITVPQALKFVGGLL